jgi:hypothetical protein
MAVPLPRPGWPILLSLAISLPATAAAQQGSRPPTIEEHYGGPPPGVHDNVPPPSPADYPEEQKPGELIGESDPNHPLKGSKDPGSAWDAHPSAPRFPDPADWPWKELFYDLTVPSALEVTNRCESPQPVYITHDLPYLTIQETAVIPPGGIDVPATITTPPEPPSPIRTGAPGQPGWGWVEPPHYDPATGTSTRMPGEPEFHQPNFVDIKGKVSVWHPWIGRCLPNRQVWTVTGHIHFRPPPPKGGGGGPEKIAAPDPCVVYWNIGAPPPGFDGRDCTDIIRGLAMDYFGRILVPLMKETPGSWSWVPSAGEISTMDMEQILALKERADSLIDEGTT